MRVVGGAGTARTVSPAGGLNPPCVLLATMRRRPPQQDRQRSPFPPIADYGFLSDCETTALVAPSGNVEWMCLPRMDSPSVFGAILDRDAGAFRLGPADVTRPGRAPLPAGHDGAGDQLGHPAAGSSSATCC